LPAASNSDGTGPLRLISFDRPQLAGRCVSWD
jgi:hypothetical protein